MKEGHPVTLLFLIFILVAYVGGYIWDIQTESDRLFKIASDQKNTINKLNEENEQLHTLTETMFQYIHALESPGKSPVPPWTGDDSPIHTRPI